MKSKFDKRSMCRRHIQAIVIENIIRSIRRTSFSNDWVGSHVLNYKPLIAFNNTLSLLFTRTDFN